MSADLGHGITDSWIGLKELVMLTSVPVKESRKLLGDGRKEANNDANRGALHLASELVDGCLVGDAVIAVELNELPDSEENGGKHEDGGPVLQLVSAIDR